MPGEFKTLVQPPHEKMKDFNERLREVCEQSPITSFEAVVVDGQPVITLMSEVMEATEEDVEKAKEDDPEDDLKIGDMIPVDDTVLVQVSGVGAAGEKASNTEHAHDVLNKRAGGEAIEVRYFTGPSVRWEPDYNDVLANAPKPKQVLVQAPVTYAAIVSLQEPVMAEAETGKK